jgi:hypothetical protein
MKRLVVVIRFANVPQNLLQNDDDDENNNNNNNNKVAGYIHWTMCKHMGLQVTDRCYENIPERVINVNSNTIMWDVPLSQIEQY